MQITGNKRVYYCQRCLNHNRLEPRKNHKCDCLYATCTCNKCILVEKRRVLNTQLHELEDVFDGDNDGENDEQLSVTSRNKGGMLKFKKDRYFMCLVNWKNMFLLFSTKSQPKPFATPNCDSIFSNFFLHL